MNSTLLRRPIARPQVPARAGLAERLVLKALAQMPHGQLILELPDGRRQQFGGEEGGRWRDEARAPGVQAIPGKATIVVRRSRFFSRCMWHGDIGFAEAYLDGDWDTPDIRAVIAWFLLNHEHTPTLSGSPVQAIGLNLLRAAHRLAHRLRPNSRTIAARNIREHYDLSNAFFELWLDPSLMYSAAKWGQPSWSLGEAQRAKNAMLCRKLRLTPADHVLEIGTGWGGWALHAAREHGCRVTSLTLSVRQRDLAMQRIAAAGLSHRIEVRLQDYRALPAHETYDKLISIEMLEAVGHRYLREWCGVATRALKRDGLMALQFINCPDARYASFRRGVDFIQKHIFPGSLLLSVNRLNDLLAAEGGFMLHHLEDMGQDYAQTLHVWRQNFSAQRRGVETLGFDDRFVRKWNYYLAYCEAAFAMRNISVVQTVHTRPNNLKF